MKADEFGKHYAELVTRDAAEQVRRNALPQKPDDYKLELPKDFKLPEGTKFEIDAAAPELSRFREAAVKHGLSQDAVTDLMGLYAETQVASKTAIDAAKAVEVKKLGANGPARITALETFFTGLLGAEDARAVGSMLVSARIVQAAERLAAKFASQGAGSYSRAHTEPPEPAGKVSDEQWNQMGPAERFDYARKHDQSQFMNGASR